MDTDIIKAQIKEYFIYGDYSNEATIEKYKTVLPALIDLIGKINKHDEKCIKKRKPGRSLDAATTFGINQAVPPSKQNRISEVQESKGADILKDFMTHLETVTGVQTISRGSDLKSSERVNVSR